MLLQTPSIFDIFFKIWLFIISKSQRRFVLLSLIPNTPTPATTCLLLCLMSLSWSDPGRGVGVCNEQGDRQQQAAVQMSLRNHGLQGQH